MARSKPKSNPPASFEGRWHIVSMSMWDEDFINAEEQGYIEFKKGDQGEFHFGYVHGSMDCRATTRDGQPAVEWSWEGNDEMDEASGSGWAVPGLRGRARTIGVSAGEECAPRLTGQIIARGLVARPSGGEPRASAVIAASSQVNLSRFNQSMGR